MRKVARHIPKQLLGFGAVVFLAGLLFLGLCASSFAATTPLAGLDSIPDTTSVLGGKTVGPDGVAEDDLHGTVTPLSFPGVPAGAHLSGYDLEPGGLEFLSFDITVLLPGNLTVQPRDVVQFDGTNYSLAFVGAQHGVPDGTRISSIAMNKGKLLLSFDVTVNLPGLPANTPVDPRDVVLFDGMNFSLVLDGVAAGVPAGVNLDGLHRAESNGHLFLSFDGSGAVGSVAFFDQNAVLEYDPVARSFALAYEGTTASTAWPLSSNLRDFAVPPDADGDGVTDAKDNCPFTFNPDQKDTGGIGFASPPDGIGDACQCGDVNGDGFVTAVDAVEIERSLLIPPTAVLAQPDHCVVGGGGTCTAIDAVIVDRALLAPPTATIHQACPPALPKPLP